MGLLLARLTISNGDDSSSSIPVGNESGRAGPGRRLEIDLEGTS